MIVFVISLKNEKERRAFMRRQLESLCLDYEFIDAIRGTERIDDPRWYDDASARQLEDRSLRAGEVGCALSHASVYAEIVKRQLPWALVLEDDGILHPDLPMVLRALENGIIEQGDLVFLERCDYYRLGSAKPLFETFRIVNPIFIRHGSDAGAGGYVITYKAALAIKDINIPVHFPADNWGYYRGLVRYRGVSPTLTLIHQDLSFGSTVAVEGKRQKIHRYSIFEMLWNSFKIYTSVGRFLKHFAKKALGRE
jgi:glycosyl transferase family 25